MDIFGVGPLELLLIAIIALILFGPTDLVKAGQAAGRFLRRLVLSDEWRAMQKASRELSHLPTRLMREAGMEDAAALLAEVKHTGQDMVLKDLSDLQRWQEDIGAEAAPPIILPTPADRPADPAQPPSSPPPSKDTPAN